MRGENKSRCCPRQELDSVERKTGGKEREREGKVKKVLGDVYAVRLSGMKDNLLT